jgi:hypothetical protein
MGIYGLFLPGMSRYIVYPRSGGKGQGGKLLGGTDGERDGGRRETGLSPHTLYERFYGDHDLLKLEIPHILVDKLCQRMILLVDLPRELLYKKHITKYRRIV